MWISSAKMPLLQFISFTTQECEEVILRMVYFSSDSVIPNALLPQTPHIPKDV